jgi:hypothetical protein
MVSSVSREKAGLAGPVRSLRTDVTQFVREGERLIERPWYQSTVYYDSKGNPTEQLTHNPNGSVARAVYCYDHAGRMSEIRGESDGKLGGRTVYLYDAEGRLS